MEDYSEIIEQVDQQSEDLMEEFFEHYDRFVEAHPDKTDKTKIFGGWVVQKIAGLQVAVIQLARDLYDEEHTIPRSIVDELFSEDLKKDLAKQNTSNEQEV
jgi:hypothetical protein